MHLVWLRLIRNICCSAQPSSCHHIFKPVIMHHYLVTCISNNFKTHFKTKTKRKGGTIVTSLVFSSKRAQYTVCRFESVIHTFNLKLIFHLPFKEFVRRHKHSRRVNNIENATQCLCFIFILFESMGKTERILFSQ